MAKSKLAQQLETIKDELTEESEEIRFQNEQALKAEAPGVYRSDEEQRVAPHSLDKFREVMDGVYGLNMKGRLLYNLNFIAQRTLREALREHMSDNVLDDTLSDMLTEEELADMFGFEKKQVYPLDHAIHWTMITYIAAHDVSQYTEADRYGRKTKPFAWMNDVIRTPVTMAIHDASFGMKAAIDQQVVQMHKLGYTDQAGKALEKFSENQKAHAKEQVKAKITVLRQFQAVSDHAYKYEYGTEECFDALSEMISEIGLNIPEILVDIAQRYVDSATEKFDAGKYVGEIDERIIGLLPKTEGNVGKGHAESVGKREHGKAMQADYESLAYAEHMARVDLDKVPTNPGVNQAGVDEALAARTKRTLVKAADAAKIH